MNRKNFVVLVVLFGLLFAIGTLAAAAPSVSYYTKVWGAGETINVGNYATGQNVSFLNDLSVTGAFFDPGRLIFEQKINPQYGHGGKFLNKIDLRVNVFFGGSNVGMIYNMASEAPRSNYPASARQVSFLQFVYRSDYIDWLDTLGGPDAVSTQQFYNIGGSDYIKQDARVYTEFQPPEPDALNLWDANYVNRHRKGWSLPTPTNFQSGYMNSQDLGTGGSWVNGGMAQLSQFGKFSGDYVTAGQFSNVAASSTPVTVNNAWSWINFNQSVFLDY